jgi:hypothetical protein
VGRENRLLENQLSSQSDENDNVIPREACSEHTGSAQHSACHELNSRPREAGGDGAVDGRAKLVGMEWPKLVDMEW